jgi:hypothetical protein
MKTIATKIGTFKIPNKFILAAYAGACADKMMSIHGSFYGGNFKIDFLRNYRFVFKYIKSFVSKLPNKLSLKRLVEFSPANNY